jgi:predicted ABC-type ATPase
MNKEFPRLFIIAGPNGAGKTTSAVKLLPDYLHCEEYVNADSIAYGISQFRPDSVAIYAGRLMLLRIEELFKQKKSFAFETTLASRNFVKLLKKCKQAGYSINIIFLWLQSPELALERVAVRVKNGGHSIPKDTILRRYKSGVENFLKLYIPHTENWTVYDNSFKNPELIARKILGNEIEIFNETTWRKMKEVV